MCIIGDFDLEKQQELLMQAGIIPDKQLKYQLSMERLVFAEGDPNEVYTQLEIQFTERFPNVCVFREYEKQLNNGTITCRTISTTIESVGYEAICDCIEFEKIINKALDGFNIFFFVANECIYFGCRLYDKDSTKDCFLSFPLVYESELEAFLDGIMYCVDIDDFATYYANIVHSIAETTKEFDYYEDRQLRNRAKSIIYLEGLEDVERSLGIDCSSEKISYYESQEISVSERFSDQLSYAIDELSFIKSTKVNTYEMLFDADEMMRMALNAEEKMEKMSAESTEAHTEPVDSDAEATALVNDPEEMIKLLKKRRGL